MEVNELSDGRKEGRKKGRTKKKNPFVIKSN